MSLVKAAERLRDEAAELTFGGRVATVYHPLEYAWDPHRRFLERFMEHTRPVAVAIGMNPGPWGMAQTGVPFGDVVKVKEWMGLTGEVSPPTNVRPDRPVLGYASTRREGSGTRLYTLAEEVYGTPERFFEHWGLANYVPLIFYDKDGKNLTPPNLLKADRERLFEVCDRHLRAVIDHLKPKYAVGIGKFATDRALAADLDVERVLRIAHPSPANPRANRGWGKLVREELADAPDVCPG